MRWFAMSEAPNLPPSSPADPPNEPVAVRRFPAGLIGAILLSYPAFFINWIFAISLTLFSFWRGLKISWKAALMCLGISPFLLIPGFSFATGVFGYFTGTGQIQTFGLP